ncbi:MAG TPA: von Willebrand factor type A domain-containing protein [Planctomycetota bacterium]|nr:von Willebrand factor type A domain-containing protein [Planctomycetota bacterium]
MDPTKPPNERPEHLDYLLTAYLFENISAAGKTEVESHLLKCAACRAQLDELRATLGIAQTALDNHGREYVFEKRRKQRVLDAAKAARHGVFSRLVGGGFGAWQVKLAAVAAIILFSLLLGNWLMTPQFSRAREASARRPLPRGNDSAGGTEFDYSERWAEATPVLQRRDIAGAQKLEKDLGAKVAAGEERESAIKPPPSVPPSKIEIAETPKAATSSGEPGMLVYPPGYQDDYTEKDARLLKNEAPRGSVIQGSNNTRDKVPDVVANKVMSSDYNGQIVLGTNTLKVPPTETPDERTRNLVNLVAGATDESRTAAITVRRTTRADVATENKPPDREALLKRADEASKGVITHSTDGQIVTGWRAHAAADNKDPDAGDFTAQVDGDKMQQLMNRVKEIETKNAELERNGLGNKKTPVALGGDKINLNAGDDLGKILDDLTKSAGAPVKQGEAKGKNEVLGDINNRDTKSRPGIISEKSVGLNLDTLARDSAMQKERDEKKRATELLRDQVTTLEAQITTKENENALVNAERQEEARESVRVLGDMEKAHKVVTKLEQSVAIERNNSQGMKNQIADAESELEKAAQLKSYYESEAHGYVQANEARSKGKTEIGGLEQVWSKRAGATPSEPKKDIAIAAKDDTTKRVEQEIAYARQKAQADAEAKQAAQAAGGASTNLALGLNVHDSTNPTRDNVGKIPALPEIPRAGVVFNGGNGQIVSGDNTSTAVVTAGTFTAPPVPLGTPVAGVQSNWASSNTLTLSGGVTTSGSGSATLGNGAGGAQNPPHFQTDTERLAAGVFGRSESPPAVTSASTAGNNLAGFAYNPPPAAAVATPPVAAPKVVDIPPVVITANPQGGAAPLTVTVTNGATTVTAPEPLVPKALAVNPDSSTPPVAHEPGRPQDFGLNVVGGGPGQAPPGDAKESARAGGKKIPIQQFGNVVTDGSQPKPGQDFAGGTLDPYEKSDSIVVRGNDTTKDKVLSRQLELAPGERVDTDKLKIAESRLKNSQHFEDDAAAAVKVPADVAAKAEGGEHSQALSLNAPEKPAGSLDMDWVLDDANKRDMFTITKNVAVIENGAPEATTPDGKAPKATPETQIAGGGGEGGGFGGRFGRGPKKEPDVIDKKTGKESETAAAGQKPKDISEFNFGAGVSSVDGVLGNVSVAAPSEKKLKDSMHDTDGDKHADTAQFEVQPFKWDSVGAVVEYDSNKSAAERTLGNKYGPDAAAKEKGRNKIGISEDPSLAAKDPNEFPFDVSKGISKSVLGDLSVGKAENRTVDPLTNTIVPSVDIFSLKNAVSNGGGFSELKAGGTATVVADPKLALGSMGFNAADAKTFLGSFDGDLDPATSAGNGREAAKDAESKDLPYGSRLHGYFMKVPDSPAEAAALRSQMIQSARSDADKASQKELERRRREDEGKLNTALSAAQAEFQFGRNDLALKQAEKVLELDPGNPEAAAIKAQLQDKNIDSRLNYKEEEYKVCVKPESCTTETIPPVYETRTRKVLVTPNSATFETAPPAHREGVDLGTAGISGGDATVRDKLSKHDVALDNATANYILPQDSFFEQNTDRSSKDVRDLSAPIANVGNGLSSVGGVLGMSKPSIAANSGAKVNYNNSGTLLIPQQSLPPGLDTIRSPEGLRMGFVDSEEINRLYNAPTRASNAPILLLHPRLDPNFPSQKAPDAPVAQLVPPVIETQMRKVCVEPEKCVKHPVTGVFETRTRKICVTPEHDGVPAVFKDEEYKVCVKPESCTTETIPAQYEDRPVQVVVKPATWQFNSPTTEELYLRGYRFFHTENPKLDFAQFLRRPDSIRPAPLSDDGLDEDVYIDKYGTRPFVDCARDHLSTFSLDVDTAAYTLARANLREGKLPAPESVKVEEFLNYFKQDYAVQGGEAFGVFAESATSPFLDSTQLVRDTYAPASDPRTRELLRIGIKSRDPRPNERKPSMLTFVIDTSGSMSHSASMQYAGSRLHLVKDALKDLVESLNAEDAIGIVGFGDQAELILPPTQARQKPRILEAIDGMTAGGATNVEAGLNLGFRLADEAFALNGVNRMILCSDGVANLGAKGPDEILKTVKLFAQRGISISTVGVGRGQVNDPLLRRLADEGDGSCHYADSLDEAKKIFAEKLPPHLNVLAKDAKVQVDFNVDTIKSYRLLGYEKRKIADKDFRNDKVDAGEVAHSTLITVFYELVRQPGSHGPLGKVYLRWKDAGSPRLDVIERNYPLDESICSGPAQNASSDFRFLACVARFAELLRESPWTRHGSYSEVLTELDALPADYKAKPAWSEVRDLVTRALQLSVAKWKTELQ